MISLSDIQPQINSIEERISQLRLGRLDSDNIEEYKAFLDEVYPVYKMGNIEFLPSQILDSDRFAFDEGLLEYLESEIENLESELAELRSELADSI